MTGFLGGQKLLVGMVHVGALPGTPKSCEDLDTITARACDEARMLEAIGFNAIIIENMHDRPYVHGDKLGPEIVAGMTRVACAVRDAIGIPFGVQILSGGNRHAVAVAQAAKGQFIRCENFVFSHIADEGLLPEAEAGTLLRYRRSLGADSIAICCDIKKKHASHAITGDVSLAECAAAAEFFGADAVIVTGAATGRPTRVEDVAEARAATRLPILVGSGVNPRTVEPLFEHADALIVGSYLKEGGLWSNPLDPARCRAVVEAARKAGVQ
ncbi:MAG: BtpA/SgcQ family protein [Phycisphaerales bacterium]